MSLDFIKSLPEEYREKATSIINNLQNDRYTMADNFANAIEDKHKLEEQLQEKYNSRLQKTALEILCATICSHSRMNSSIDVYDVRSAIRDAKLFLQEIDNANN